jgi:putative hydrolase of the HAD superfamily
MRSDILLSSVTVQAVIFDWGGTLTPWHTVDHPALWLSVCAPHFPAGRAEATAAALCAAELELWRQASTAQRSATLDHVFTTAGVTAPDGLLDTLFAQWDPHTFTDPDVAPLFRQLRGNGIKIGVLSNTMWPRAAHERVFRRDDVLDLIDGSVYTSEIARTKPHPEAFAAAMKAVGVSEAAACVFVGDRPFDDIYGAKSFGMRAVLVPNDGVPAFAGAQPDAVINRLAELPGHLASWE